MKLRLVAWLFSLASLAASAQPVLDADVRTERDSARLARVQAGAQADQARERNQARVRAATRARLDKAIAEREALALEATRLAARADDLGDDLDQGYAVVRTALTTLARRVDGGPMALDRSSLSDDSRRLAAASADIDRLYDAWFALHDAWIAGGEIVTTDAPLTGRDGQRRARRLTRYGDVTLAHRDANSAIQAVAVDPIAGLIIAPYAPAPQRGVGAFLLRLLQDGGAIGVVIVVCAGLGAITLVRAARGRPDTGRDVAVLRSGTLLLGLLGTVVGLIHTFRGLARTGGGDVALAAAGIAHALATTALALIVAITLTLAHGVFRRRTSSAPRRRTGRKLSTARWRWPGWLRPPGSILAGIALTCALFVLMQWLTQRPLSELPPPEPLRVTRIDLPSPTPPPRPPREQRTPPPSSVAAAALAPIDAPADVSAPAIATPNLALPTLAVPTSLIGAGGSAPVGAGQLWQGSAARGVFEGKDLVPITSARPRYPTAALEAGIDGFVDLIFEIDADGRVSNVRVLDADPAGVFEQAAAQAVTRWLYAPFRLNGQPVAREATQRLTFDHRSASVTWQDARP